MSSEPPDDDGDLPRYLKVVLLIAALVVLFIIVIDVLAFAQAL